MHKPKIKQYEHVFLKTIGLTFIFNAINIHYQSCPPSSKPPKQNYRFVFFWLCIRNNMLIKLCVRNYSKIGGLVNDRILKTSITYNKDPIIWIDVKKNPKPVFLDKRKI